MPTPACCDNPKPIWTARRTPEGYSDSQICGSCGTVTEAYTYKIPVLIPTPERCLNCGSALEPDTVLEGDDEPLAFHCDTCMLSDAEANAQHEAWAAMVDPEMPAAAMQLMDSGRVVLALKVASAVLRDDRDHLEASAVRLQALEFLGYGDTAAAEARDWTKRPTAPDESWSILATLEANQGNVAGALRALQRYLRKAPNDAATWIEYSELLFHTGDRLNALSSAQHAVSDEAQRGRALSLINEIVNLYLADKDPQTALKAIEYAGDFSLGHAPLLFARASTAALQEDLDKAVQWLERALEVDPNHVEAQQALERIKPSGKKRWTLW